MAWSTAASLVIECKYFETDIIIKLFLGYGVVYTFVTRWVKVAKVPTLNNCREFFVELRIQCGIGKLSLRDFAHVRGKI